jgi:hypothetical protein
MPMYGGGFKRNWSLVQSLSVCLSEKVRSHTVGTDSPAETTRAFFHTSETRVQKNKMHLNCIERSLTQYDGVQETIRQFISR